MKVALIVGHKSRSPGAGNSAHPVSEYGFNARLAVDIWEHFYYGSSSIAPAVEIIYRRTYASLPGDVNATYPDFAVAMHANASTEHNATGTEVLYYHRSHKGAKVAAVFQDEFLKTLELPDRGIKPVDSEGRGGSLLKQVACPIVICEPFFIDNDSDLAIAADADLSGAYINAISNASEL